MVISKSRLKKLEKKIENRKSLHSNKNHLENIDFTEDINLEDVETIQKIILKTDLKIFLNQAEEVLKYQDAVAKGVIKSIPENLVKALGGFHKNLEIVSGLSKIKPKESEVLVRVDFGFDLEDLPEHDPECKEVE